MKITKIAIQGFRSFSGKQEISLDAPLCLIYGKNSHGKTSFSEALEFLLCGKTARRDLVAVTKTEYVDSLKNAFHTGDVFVEAWISYDKNGVTHMEHIRRKLRQDYPAGNSECETILEKESATGTWELFSFSSIGLGNWDSPERLPIIFQHTLRYVSAAKPFDRLNYFREILDIKDISDFRDALKDVIENFSLDPDNIDEKNLVNAANLLRTHASFSKIDALFQDPTPSKAERRRVLIEIMRDLLVSAGEDRSSVDSEAEASIISKFNLKLSEFREQQSNLPSLNPPSLGAGWVASSAWDTTFAPIKSGLTTAKDEYSAKNEIIDEQITALTPFLQSGIDLPDYATQFDGSKKCNFCNTTNAVTWEKIQIIRDLLAKPTAITRVRNQLQTEIGNLITKMDNILVVLNAQLPQSLMNLNILTVQQYAIKRPELFETWKSAFSTFKASAELVRLAASDLKLKLSDLKGKAQSGENVSLPDLATILTDLKTKITAFEVARTDYVHATSEILPIINTEIDAQSGRQNWSVLKSLWDNRTVFHKGLIERCSKNRVKQNLSNAFAQITTANGKILKEDKFPSLSAEIVKWWNMLRPQEPVLFKDVSPKGQGLTGIDLKALLVNEAGTGNAERNAVAIFSDSQLNCLGLSIFLARTVRENSGMIMFDDPVQSLDREHADFLTMDVVKALVETHGLQVIILTHDDLLWDDLKTFYETKAPKGIYVQKIKQEGTFLTDRDSKLGDLMRKIARIHRIPDATVYDYSANEIRKAAELFCRDVICKCEPVVANRPTFPSQFDGSMLPQLITGATPYLTVSADHTTTLQYINSRLNKGSHASYEAYQPGTNALQRIFGELKKMIKAYDLQA